MQFIDITGKTFGHLTVVGHEGSRREKWGSPVNYWRMRCECGGEKILPVTRLRKAKTCGDRAKCWFAQNSRRRPRSHNTNPGASRVFKKYRWGAEDRGYTFTLSLEDVAEIIKQDCSYCGCPPSNKFRSDTKWAKLAAFQFSGMDRIRNDEGYVPGNVVPCCIACNRMKLIFTREEFLAHVARIYHWTHRRSPLVLRKSASCSK